MIETEAYIIPCNNVFDESITNTVVKNKEEKALDFLKKERIGFDMKMVGDNPQSVMMMRMEGTLFKNQMVVIPIDNSNRSMLEMFEKLKDSFSVDRLANEVANGNGINRFEDKYATYAKTDKVQSECKLVKIRLDGLALHFKQLEEKEKSKALGKVFIDEANKDNPLFVDRTISFDVSISSDLQKGNIKEVIDAFETEMSKAGFKRNVQMKEEYNNGLDNPFHIENPKRRYENAISLQKGNERIEGFYEESYAKHNNMRVSSYWSLECRLKGESLSAFNKVLEKLPKHELSYNFNSYDNVEVIAYQTLKKMGFKDSMYSPNYKYNGKKIRNTKGLTAKEVEAIDIIEKWARDNNKRNSKGYILNYYASTERPKYAFSMLLKEAKRQGFSYKNEKAKVDMER